MDILLYLLIGALTGTVAGLLGVGGGLMVVPALDLMLAPIMPHAVVMRVAAGSSLAIMIPTAFSACLSHQLRGNVLWRVWLRLLPGVLLGILSGATVAHVIPSLWLRIAFGAFAIVIAYRMFRLVKPKLERRLPSLWGMTSVAFAIGAKSGALGLGGGALSVPFLTRYNVPMHQARGTSSALSLTIACIGSIAFAWHGAAHMGHIADASGYIYWPAVYSIAPASLCFAPLGTWLGNRVSVPLLKRVFALFLLAVAINMFWMSA
ncbi:MAG: UPF0721 transmembrane protein [marine bacterium B5-7]|nr:MAG: UPF0721 transmembrane protein [marine bacterium B5-7]